MKQVEVNKEAKLSEHFKLGELTRSKSHPEIYNIPSHVHIENLKRVCVWLEALRERYNRRYVLAGAGGQVPKSRLAKAGGQVPKVEVFGENGWGSGPESRSFRGKLYFETRPRGADCYYQWVSVGGTESEGWGRGNLESSDGVRGRYPRGGEGATDSLCVYSARLCGRDETGL